MTTTFYQAAEKSPSAALLSPFVLEAYLQVRLSPQDCLPDRQVKGTTGAPASGISQGSTCICLPA
ncbi:MAG: hypothetical protein WCO26_21180, partial [Deltaproteobacteria bacterium]